MLSACRVLDLTDERGQLAGMMLAQLGAYVIAVEPPGGVRSRHLEPSPALHLAYNRGKRSVVLDLSDDTDRRRFLELVTTADILVESADPGTWEALGLGREALEAVNPGLVTVSISAFGRSGPKAEWAASDLIAEAAACELMLTGDADRSPVRVSAPQAFLNAAADAACGALTALREREVSGRGQHVDISAQEAAAMMTQGQLLAAAYGAYPIARNGAGLKVGPLRINWVYPASDGWVTITLLFGPISAYTVRLIEWMVEDGAIEPGAAKADWVHFLSDVLSGKVAAEELDHLQERIAAFTGSHTKAELLAGALERRVLMAPVATVPRAALQRPAQRPRLLGGGRRGPLPGTVRDRGWRWAPHGSTRPQPGPGPAHRRGPRRRPGGCGNAGCWGGDPFRRRAGRPAAGATRRHQGRRPDLVHGRTGDHTDDGRLGGHRRAGGVRQPARRRAGSGPFPRGKSDPDAGGYGLTHNSGKLGLALDLTKPDSRPVLEDLLRWADVAVVNYSPRATRNLRLDWATLSELNPT